MTEVVETQIIETPVVEAPAVSVDTAVPTDNRSLWYEGLPDDVKTNKSISGFKDAGELAKSYLHQTTLLGKKVNEWAAEDITRLYGKLGRPETPEAYKFADDMDTSIKTDFAKKAFDAGLTQEQAKILADNLVLEARSKAEVEIKNEEMLKKTWADELKNEFGTAYDKRIETARRAFNELADDSLKQLIQDTGLHEHPSMIKLFSRLGKDFLESDRIVSSDAESKFGTTPTEAKTKIGMRMADKDFKDSYFNPLHPKHRESVAEINKLYQISGN